LEAAANIFEDRVILKVGELGDGTKDGVREIVAKDIVKSDQ